MAENKKNIVAEALADVDAIKAAIKEESKNTISALLKEEMRKCLNEAIENDEDEYEIKDEKDTTENDEPDVNEPEESEVEKTEDESEENVEDLDIVDDEEINAEEGEDYDEWSGFEQYKVDDDTYDLTGEQDKDTLVKVYKLLKDEDNVIIKKDGNKISLEDKDNNAEYVIELGADDEPKEETSFEVEFDEPEEMNENKRRKTMKENKEMVFEVDLGYTDNYQKEDPIAGLSANEPSKFKTLDKGIPTGTEKPWAGNAKSKANPFGEKAIEESAEEAHGTQFSTIDNNATQPDEPIEEGGAETFQKQTKRVKSAGKPKQGAPVRAPHSENGKLEESIIAKTEAVLKENKELKETMSKVKAALQEALLLNVNLGKVTKLFMENTTTQNEKVDIINRFNEAKTIDQSNALYESIKRELNNNGKQTVTLEEKSLTADAKCINETKLYESEDLKEVKNFMKRMLNC